MRHAFTSIFILLWLSFQAEAAVQIPLNLNHADRQQVVRLLGLGTSTKLLSDPYPLGGYAGFEVGISIENLPVEDLSRLGNTIATPQRDISYPMFSVGKGVYNNFDVFFHFNPYSGNTDISQYGGIVRWGFYQAKLLPISVAVLIHLNSSNFNNQVMTRSMGLDFTCGVNVDNVALFIGAGPVQARGRFIGGASGITDTGLIESETINGFHTAAGATIHISDVFLSGQIDHYDTTIYSAKLGLRL